MKTEKRIEQIRAQIKDQIQDREHYRLALFERLESIEKKIEATERQISELRKKLDETR